MAVVSRARANLVGAEMLSPSLLELVPNGPVLSEAGQWVNFTRDAQGRQRAALCVGTGTGLAPLRAMLKVEAQKGAVALGLLLGC